MKRLMYRKRTRGNARGFTLVEMMVTISISSLLIVGSIMLLTHLVTVSIHARNETQAILNLQYTSFWLTQDVIQAQKIGNLIDPNDPDGEGMGNVTGNGWPIALEWVEWDGDTNHITYEMANVTDDLGRHLWRLDRTHWLKKSESAAWQDYGTVTIAEYLDPGLTKIGWACTCPNDDEDAPCSLNEELINPVWGTPCRERTCQKCGTALENANMLRMEVTAWRDLNVANNTYNITPRAFAG